ncbi:hypothetical protein J3459_017782 [Metarhizium acridum]|nr:hypothetical protein J3459_017782 [Metarhizium acridum]
MAGYISNSTLNIGGVKGSKGGPQAATLYSQFQRVARLLSSPSSRQWVIIIAVLIDLLLCQPPGYTLFIQNKSSFYTGPKSDDTLMLALF